MSACYRSNAPAVVDEWNDTQRRYREAHAAIGAFVTKYGGKALVYRGSLYRLAALDHDGAPEGGETVWRYDKKAHGWVPRRSSKQGKALAKEFDACQAGRLGDVPGLPHYVQIKGAGIFNMQGPALFDQGGYVWAYWNACDHEDVLTSGWGTLDETLWEQVKRSELELAREAKEAVDA